VALRKHKVWDAGISAWQKPYIEDPELPEWFKGQLMNELYYLVDGGGVWVDSTDGKVNEREGGGKDPYLFESKGMKRGADELDAGDVTVDIGDVDGLVKAAMGMMEQHKLGSGRGDQSSVGTFLYLEGHEYVMYNTSDVHFYAR
jgi:non-lysosomal glucosylceramidase